MRALLFDVFGTCVDWRTSIGRALERHGLPPELAVGWRDQYQPQLETVRSGARRWVNLDLVAAGALGLRTVFVARPGEEPKPAGDDDLTPRDFTELAEAL